MGWGTKRKADLVEDLNLLLADFCMQWGFCNQLRADHLLQPGKVLAAEEFVGAVLEAEGMNAEYEPGWHRRMRDKFVERYGSSVSLESYVAPSDLTGR
jgi:hypothetical protein